MTHKNEGLRQEIAALKASHEAELAEIAGSAAERRQLVQSLDEQAVEFLARTTALRASMAKVFLPKASENCVATNTIQNPSETRTSGDPAKAQAPSAASARRGFVGVVIPAKRHRPEVDKVAPSLKRLNIGTQHSPSSNTLSTLDATLDAT
ncbi:hypothetical protein R3P38DRAFT_3228674 [Favolaschia claudopus]|uniref:Uncharacterized protein n=1 Tax=Favolaschia claudopus TaxID=2862362 RepID=A0AAV9ZQA8_9AGAR